VGRTMRDESWCHKLSSWSPQEPALTAVLTPPHPDTTVCTLRGTINPTTTFILESALLTAQREANTHLIIDLSAVTSIDLAGLSALLEARHYHHINGRGRLAVVPPVIYRAFSDPYAVVGLEASFDMYPNLTKALHACTSRDAVSNP
jgi:anti-anti-sigma regulatory factor